MFVEERDRCSCGSVRAFPLCRNQRQKASLKMAHFSFRSRPLDIEKPLPIVTHEIEDDEDAANWRAARGVPDVGTGMEKEEEKVEKLCAVFLILCACMCCLYECMCTFAFACSLVVLSNNEIQQYNRDEVNQYNI